MRVWIAVVFYIVGSNEKETQSLYLCARISALSQYVTLADLTAITMVKANVHPLTFNVNLSPSTAI